MTTHADGREYDIIFAGGGTAACAAAGRLARNNPDVSILIIESGKNNLNETAVVTPAMFASHLLPDSQTCQFYQSNAEEALNGRQSFVPVGKTLGGGSSVNLLCYTRAQAVDFDSWKAKGWDFQSLLPYIRRLETYHPEDTTGDKALHGRDGPVHVTFGTGIPDGPADDVLQAAAAIGIPTVPDLQDFTSCSAVSRWPKYISTEGKRQDAAHCYIHPLMQSGKAPNLHLLLESRVTKVIFNDQKHACGVEYITGTSNQVRTINARKLVVVSAGALSTPSILERSGIGSQKLLKDLNIPLTSDLPDVGEHYQDHHVMMNPYKTSLTAEETLDCLFSGCKDFAAAIAANEPIIGRNGIDVHLKLRPSPDAVKALGTDFEELWTRDFADQPTRPLLLVGIVSTFLGDHRMVDKEGIIQYTTIGTWTSYPYSRGSIHIQSADASTPASFNTGFLSHPADVKMQIWAYKTQRELFRRTNAYRGELAIGHPKFPEGSKAALRDGAAATFASASDREQLADLEYTKEDEAAIEHHVRNNVASTWHSLGTCRMAPREQGGVVDEELNVYGVTGLKCCDLSICPSNVGANTNHTALLIGEKAADIIAKDLGLKIT